MNGNGCAGSIDSGVSTGNIDSRKCSSSQALSSSVSASGRMVSMPSFFRRSISPERLSCWSSCRRLDLEQQLFELLFRRAAVGALDGDALANLAGKAGDADHEELVEIGRRDRQEAHTLEQRMVRVLRFLEHAPVELQPGEFAVDEAVRIARHGFGRGLAHKFVLDRPQFGHFRSFVTAGMTLALAFPVNLSP